MWSDPSQVINKGVIDKAVQCFGGTDFQVLLNPFFEPFKPDLFVKSYSGQFLVPDSCGPR